MNMILRYLPQIEQIQLQGLSMWWYITGVARTQVHYELPKMFFFSDSSPQILAVKETGECRRFDFEGVSDFSNYGWSSCQIAQNRLFQLSTDDDC